VGFFISNPGDDPPVPKGCGGRAGGGADIALLAMCAASPIL